jgi:hypothetical protein
MLYVVYIHCQSQHLMLSNQLHPQESAQTGHYAVTPAACSNMTMWTDPQHRSRTRSTWLWIACALSAQVRGALQEQTP